MTGFQLIKDALTSVIELSRDALHIHLGLVIFFAAHWIFRRRLGSFFPLVVLLAVVLAGEAFDLLFQYQRAYPLRWQESLIDIWNTMFWPALLTIYGRWGGRPKDSSGRAQD